MPQIRAPPTAQHHRSFPAPSTATRLRSYTGGVRWPTLRTAHGTTGAITALNPVRPSPSCRCREVCHRHQCPGTRPPDRCLQHRRTTPRVSVRSPRGSSAWCSSCSALCWPSHLVSRRSFWGQRTQTGTVSGRRDRNGHDRHVAGGLSLVLLVVGTVVLFALGIGAES